MAQLAVISARKISDLPLNRADLSVRGAGDENRTRTISLGIRPIRAA